MHPSRIFFVGHGGGHDKTSPQLLFQSTAKAKKIKIYRGISATSEQRVRTEATLSEDVRFGALMQEMTAEDTEGGKYTTNIISINFVFQTCSIIKLSNYKYTTNIISIILCFKHVGSSNYKVHTKHL